VQRQEDAQPHLAPQVSHPVPDSRCGRGMQWGAQPVGPGTRCQPPWSRTGRRGRK
jgi:hypothetical protein